MKLSIESICWCGLRSTMVPVEWVSEGRTNSCSDPDCEPGCPFHDTDEFDLDLEPTPVPPVKPRRYKMNRFTADQFDPLAESSGTSETIRAQYPTALILNVTPGCCPCGCGERPRGKTATFGMGHDIRLRGKLIRAAAAGAKVVRVTKEADSAMVAGDPDDPAAFAAEYSTPKLDWRAAVADAASRIAVRTNKPNPERDVLEAATGPQPEGRVLVRVGKWDYTGAVAAIYDDPSGVLYDYVGRDSVRHLARQLPDGTLKDVAS